MIEEMPFEEAMSELETLVRQLEEGKFSLEEAISAFEKGSKLKSICEEKLKQAQLKIEKILPSSSAALQTEKFDF
jgi:exodeoxyribonuclease VII small subunit